MGMARFLIIIPRVLGDWKTGVSEKSKALTITVTEEHLC